MRHSTTPHARWVAVFAGSAVACGGGAVATNAAPEPVVVVVPSTPPVAAPESSERERLAADAAVVRLVGELDAVEATCRTRWVDGAVHCEAPEVGESMAGVAGAYQRHYGSAPDPRSGEGRIDALPRLGGPDVTVEALTARLLYACTERCDAGRRASMAEHLEAAANACGATGKKDHCKALAEHVPPSPTLRSVREVVETCASRCDDQRVQAVAKIARDARRPRTPAERERCLRTCSAKCEPGWCGTCEMGCQVECAYHR